MSMQLDGTRAAVNSTLLGFLSIRQARTSPPPPSSLNPTNGDERLLLPLKDYYCMSTSPELIFGHALSYPFALSFYRTTHILPLLSTKA